MNGAALQAFTIAAILALLLELTSRRLFGRGPGGRFPRPVFAVASILALAIMAGIGRGADADLPAGPRFGLLAIVAGALVLFAAGLKTDYTLPSSKRHVQGSVIAGILICLGGLSAPYVGIPGIGDSSLGFIVSYLFTIVWVFLIVGLVEILCLVPLLSSLLCLGISILSLLSAKVYLTFPGLAVGGVLGGVVLGRFVGQFALGRAYAMPKADSLVLGYLIAAATLTLFMKSMTFAGLVVPLGVATIVILAVLIQGFDRTLILRPSPRE